MASLLVLNIQIFIGILLVCILMLILVRRYADLCHILFVLFLVLRFGIGIFILCPQDSLTILGRCRRLLFLL